MCCVELNCTALSLFVEDDFDNLLQKDCDTSHITQKRNWLLRDLQEEEEQLLAGPKEESRTTQAMRKFAQEEEGRLFLEKVPLHVRKLAKATLQDIYFLANA